MAHRFLRVSLAIAAGFLMATAATSARQKQANLEWLFAVDGLPTGSDGLSYLVFDTRQQLQLQWMLTNESDRGLQLPADFLSRLRFVLRRGASSVDVPARWLSAVHTSKLASDSVPVGLAMVLGPNESYSARVVLDAPLAEGRQDLAVVFASVVDSLVWSDGTGWQGRFQPEQKRTLHVRKPATAAERRIYHATESGAALRDGNTAEGMRHAREILRENPNDVGAHELVGFALLTEGRCREAIVSLELAKPPTPRRSGVYDHLAYCYMAIGEEQKAEASLRAVRPPADVARSLEVIRADLRRKGVVQ